jgi:hypothetical protein
MKKQILESALDQRQQEVLGYQINIDNYRLAIEYIDADGDPDLDDFREQLTGLLATEMLEQKKAKVILAIIEQQLAEMQ